MNSAWRPQPSLSSLSLSRGGRSKTFLELRTGNWSTEFTLSFRPRRQCIPARDSILGLLGDATASTPHFHDSPFAKDLPADGRTYVGANDHALPDHTWEGLERVASEETKAGHGLMPGLTRYETSGPLRYLLHVPLSHVSSHGKLEALALVGLDHQEYPSTNEANRSKVLIRLISPQSRQDTAGIRMPVRMLRAVRAPKAMMDCIAWNRTKGSFSML